MSGPHEILQWLKRTVARVQGFGALMADGASRDTPE